MWNYIEEKRGPVMSQFLLDLKRENNCNQKMSYTSLSYQHPEQYHGGVLDLSRRHRDSVETRKTPSPCNTSSFSEGSPSTNHGSPTTTISIRTNLIARTHQTSPNSPEDRYRNCYSPHRINSPAIEGCTVFNRFTINCPPASEKRNLQSPIDQNTTTHEQLHHNNSHNNQDEDDRMNPYFLQASAIKQQLNESDEASESYISTSSNSSSYPMVVGRDGKLSRPFKAYPHDPLSLAASFNATDTLLDSHSAAKYNTFRKRMLEQIHAANGGQPTISNPKMRRTISKGPPNTNNHNIDTIENSIEIANNNNNNDSDSSMNGLMNGMIKDSAYFERRKKNNAAAKKSRDRRRIKEDEIAIRAAFLERENIELKFELAAARKQLALYGGSTLT